MRGDKGNKKLAWVPKDQAVKKAYPARGEEIHRDMAHAENWDSLMRFADHFLGFQLAGYC